MRRALATALLLLFGTVAWAGEGCSSLDGTYNNAAEGNKAYLDDFVRKPNGLPDERLMVYGPATTGNRPTPRKHFASTATIAYDGKILQIEYHDAAGKPIVRYPADYPYTWACKGSQFEWVYEGLSGMGDDIRETRTQVTLSRHESGDLLMVEEMHDSKKKSPSRSERRFRAAPAPAPAAPR